MNTKLFQTYIQRLNFFGMTRKGRTEDRSLHAVNEDLSTSLTTSSRKKAALKVGLDIHGVIDTYPEKFKLLSQAFFRDGAEVHIVTGVKRDSAIDRLLEGTGIQFTHYFSIVEHLEQQKETVEWIDGLPYADETQWNIAKRDYCARESLDFMFDDSVIYRDTFHEVDCTFLHVIGNQVTENEIRKDGKRVIPASEY